MQIYQKLKEISLFIAGALASAFFAIYDDYLSSQQIALLIFLILSILIGLGGVDTIIRINVYLHRHWNTWRKKILIYAPYEIDSETASWVNVSLRQLKNMLIDLSFVVAESKKESAIFKYPVVINPYGGVYPENNVATQESLDRIFDYVLNGGIYINIADIPFYYAFDMKFKRGVDTTPLAENSPKVRHFHQTILTKKLHSYVYGIEIHPDLGLLPSRWKRVISIEGHAKNIGNFNVQEINNRKVTPQIAIPYGRGYFVFSTFEINNDSRDDLQALLNNALRLL